MGYLRRWKGIRDGKFVSGEGVCWRKNKYLTCQRRFKGFFLFLAQVIRSLSPSLSLSLSLGLARLLALCIYLSVFHSLSLSLSLYLSLTRSLSPSPLPPPLHPPDVPGVEPKLVSSSWSRALISQHVLRIGAGRDSISSRSQH
jgi:hypothetical protein